MSLLLLLHKSSRSCETTRMTPAERHVMAVIANPHNSNAKAHSQLLYLSMSHDVSG